jgi:Flp pilus assembly protein TadG
MIVPQRSSSDSERGAAMVEFAVSSVVLFMLVFGCIGITMAFYTYEVVNEYARDASRYAIVHGANCTAQPSGASCTIIPGAAANLALTNYLKHQIYPGINGANLRVTATYTFGPGATTCNAAACNGPGDQVTVLVTYPYLYNLPFVPQRAFTMRGTSTMVISQ